MKWEYLHERSSEGIGKRTDMYERDPDRYIGSDGEVDRFSEILNERGREGWELVSTSIFEGYPSGGTLAYHATFKRPLED